MLAVSTAAIFIRLSLEAVSNPGIGFSILLAASRLAIASLVLSPTYFQIIKAEIPIQGYYWAGIAGLCLALHFAFWITSLSLTSIAASTTLVTTNPIWIALISWLWMKIKPSPLTLLGIILAVTGGIMISFGNSLGSDGEENQFWLGNLLALIGAIMASLYFLVGKKAQNFGLSTQIYIAIAYGTAALILLPLPLFWQQSYFNLPKVVYLYMTLLAIFPQLIGHTSLNWSLRYVSPTLVSLVILLEPICATGLGFIFLQEVPSNLVILGGLIILAGVSLGLFSK